MAYTVVWDTDFGRFTWHVSIALIDYLWRATVVLKRQGQETAYPAIEEPITASLNEFAGALIGALENATKREIERERARAKPKTKGRKAKR